MISIHALLAESDVCICMVNYYCKISIHALLAESDRFYPLKTLIILPFLSTLSLRLSLILIWYTKRVGVIGFAGWGGGGGGWGGGGYMMLVC